MCDRIKSECRFIGKVRHINDILVLRVIHVVDSSEFRRQRFFSRLIIHYKHVFDSL